jgi:hypothetical protein
VRSLLDKDVPLTKEFAQEQERRRKKNLPDQMYDVTGWSLPLLYNVECVAAEQLVQARTTPVTGPYEPRGSVSGHAKIAYMVPWGTQAAGRFLAGALHDGLKVLSVNKSFTQNGREYPAGTLVVLVTDNGETVHGAVERLARRSGAEVVATDTGWTEGGINFGSANTFHLRRPVIAMLWDAPTFSASAGNTRYVIERQFHYPVTAVRSHVFSGADLSHFQVIILPDGSYGSYLSGSLGERLGAWVRSGGTLIAIGSAVSAVANLPGGLLPIQQEGLAIEGGKDGAKPSDSAKPGTPGSTGPAPGKIFATPEDLRKAIQPEHPLPDGVAGVVARADVDPETWVTAGVAPVQHLMLNGNLIFTPIKLDHGINAVTFAGPDQVVESGYLWDENRKQLAYKPAVVVAGQGRGWVVAFVTDPAFRGFMDGQNVLLLNAIFRAPQSGHGFGQRQ